MKRIHTKITVDPFSPRARGVTLILILAILLAVSGCAKKIPHSLVPEYEKRQIRLVAILPVMDKAGNPEVSALLRQRIAEALYFKGYPRVLTSTVDEKLKVFYKNVKDASKDSLPPRDVGGLLGVDAVLYSTLTDCRTSFLYLYAPTSIAVNFEMYNVRTGELLWSTGYRVGEKNFDVTPDRLKMKSCQVFEPALQQIVNKAMETLPDGPDA